MGQGWGTEDMDGSGVGHRGHDGSGVGHRGHDGSGVGHRGHGWVRGGPYSNHSTSPSLNKTLTHSTGWWLQSVSPL